MKAKIITLCGLLTALAIVLSLVERLFPLDAVVPVPGAKLGLANVVTLFALTRVSARDALAVVVCRVAISSLLMGSVTAFLFSLFGGLLSLIVMWALLRAEGTFCSLLGVSVAGAAAHNIGQVIAAIDLDADRRGGRLSAAAAGDERAAWAGDRADLRDRAFAYEKN